MGYVSFLGEYLKMEVGFSALFLGQLVGILSIFPYAYFSNMIKYLPPRIMEVDNGSWEDDFPLP